MGYELSIDIGGTFTDLYVRDDDGNRDSVKVPTTPDNPTVGFFDACQEAATAAGTSLEGLLDCTDRVIHGTTIATNAIIEDTVDETALICTDGFRGILLFREGGKDDPFEWDIDYPAPYIPRSLTYEVPERVTAEGEIETPLDEDAARRVINEIAASDVDAIAVSLLWAHANPEHERRVGELIEEAAPDISYSLSHEVNPIIREYRRTSATAIDASINGPVQSYLADLERKLNAKGFGQDPLIISSNGGIVPIDEITRTPIWVVDSGPTTLPVAAYNFTRAETGQTHVIALDMGGTSLDMGVVRDGHIPRTQEAEVGEGHMLGIEKVEVKSIGSGGGSIAWVDQGGMLRVGPESAGSAPGPACYLRGGERPTFTDAALALGYLNEEYFLGGKMEISREAALTAIETEIGDELGVDPIQAAYSIYRTSIQDIVNGVEDVTLERGIDPRKYTLSGGGGALGLPLVRVARELKVKDVLLPRNAGVICATGGLLSDIRRDFSSSQFTTSDDFDCQSVNLLLSELTDEALEFFERTDIASSNRSIQYYAKARYPRQVWELQVTAPEPPIHEDDLADLVSRFHAKHEETFKFKQQEEPVEFLDWRVEATGVTGADIAQNDDSQNEEDAQYSRREAFFDGAMETVPAYRADRLSPGDTIAGPGFVDAENTTIVLPLESSLKLTESGNYHIEP